MKVFLSWSGQKAREAAAFLRDFIPQILREAEPWLADVDVRKGDRFIDRIEAAVEGADVMILCVTRTDLSSPWMNFELGSLAHTKKPVIPVLVNFEPTELVGALALFQAVQLNRAGLRQLMFTLNDLARNALTPEALNNLFDINLPRLEPLLVSILERDQIPTSPADRSSIEVLEGVEARFDAIRGLLENLTQRLPVVDAKPTPQMAAPTRGLSSSRLRVFIGSSAEGLAVAEAIQVGLDHVAEVTLWTQDNFPPGSTTIESLVQTAPSFDYAVIVMTADDVLIKRGAKYRAPRDNLIFELGLFTGVAGRARTFLVFPRDEPIEFPSDLAGVTKLDFQMRRADSNLSAAVGAVCTRIKRVMGVS